MDGRLPVGGSGDTVITGCLGSAGGIPLRSRKSNPDDHGVEDRYSVFRALSNALCVLHSLLSEQLCGKSAIINTFYR